MSYQVTVNTASYIHLTCESECSYVATLAEWICLLCWFFFLSSQSTFSFSLLCFLSVDLGHERRWEHLTAGPPTAGLSTKTHPNITELRIEASVRNSLLSSRNNVRLVITWWSNRVTSPLCSGSEGNQPSALALFPLHWITSVCYAVF